tara:strand:+ start:5892 stop:6167 length:276 start_codon:yes stop_codon:yes gene_type:complete
MSGQKFRLLKFPHSTDDIIAERIHGLNKLICESGEDEHLTKILEMLIVHLSMNYEGLYVEQTITKLIEAATWWQECYDPNLTLSAMTEVDE